MVGRRGLCLLSFLLVAIAGGIFFGAGPLAALFIATPHVARLGATVLRWFAVAQTFSGLSIGLQGILMGAGDTRPAMIYTLVSQWAVMLPVTYLAVAWADRVPEGPLVAWTLAPTISLILMTRRFKSGRWKNGPL